MVRRKQDFCPDFSAPSDTTPEATTLSQTAQRREAGTTTCSTTSDRQGRAAELNPIDRATLREKILEATPTGSLCRCVHLKTYHAHLTDQLKLQLNNSSSQAHQSQTKDFRKTFRRSYLLLSKTGELRTRNYDENPVRIP